MILNMRSQIARVMSAIKYAPFRRSSSWNKLTTYLPKEKAVWTRLEETFNIKPSDFRNELFAEKRGLFEYESLVDSVGLMGMKLTALEKKDRLLRECLNPNRQRKLVEVMDELSDTLCKIADLCEFLRIMHPDVDMLIESQDICVELGRIIEELNTNKELYDAIKKVAEHGDKFPMTTIEEHVLNLFVFDFELCGIHLPEEDRRLVVQYNNEILKLGQAFMQNAARPRLLDKDHIPPSLKKYFQTTNEGDLIVTGYSNIADELAREYAYKIYLSPNPKQESYFDDILKYRCKLAKKCGFPTYAHRAVKGSTAESPEFVIEFLNQLHDNLQTYVQSDLELMRSVKATESNQPLAMWDVSYIIGKIKKDSLKYESKEFNAYFCLGACIEGLNLLTEQLFGISLVAESTSKFERWVPDIYKLNVVHNREGLLGHIYCDFFERDDKPDQDCHFTIKGGRRSRDGTYQNPIVVVVLNFPSPTRTTPSLLTPHMVENLFHEMGHALHSMLGRSEYQHITGTRCATDFAEVPSILMEYFFSDKRVLKSFAKHYKTGSPIPDEMVQHICNARKVCTAVELQSQIFYSVLDQVFHADKQVPGQSTKVLAETQAKYYPLPYVEKTAWHLKFNHFVGYGAKYYSYLMSRSIASIIWQQCFQSNPFSRYMGERYRTECLGYGGGKPPRALIKDYLQMEVTPSILAESLINEIKTNYEDSSEQ